jgi:hypothetical protein
MTAYNSKKIQFGYQKTHKNHADFKTDEKSSKKVYSREVKHGNDRNQF